MIIERAVIQDVVAGRDGSIVREYHRPSEVRAIAQRMFAWRNPATQEGCSNCRAANAVVIRSGLALCAACHEQRQVVVAPFTHRGSPAPAPRDDEPESRGIVGHFIVFNSESVDLGGFTEIVRPSAVDRSLNGKDDMRALWSHDTALPLGRTGPRTLKLEKDRTGLYGEIATPSWADNYLETVDRGDVSGASFGFSVLEDIWHFMRQEDKILREILDMIIYEVSPVSFPAYPATKIRVERLSARRERETLTRLQLARHS